MKRSIGLWQFAGFAFTSFAGTILHFLYDWLDNAAWIAPFSGVNESTWEHMKLLFWPMLMYALLQSRFFKQAQDFWCIQLKGTLLGLGLIPVLFYTYNGVIGKSPDWINITIFFISAAAAYLYEAKLLIKPSIACRHSRFAFALLCVIGVLFALFTFRTPSLGIFQSPETAALLC